MGQDSSAQGREDSRPIASIYYKSNSDIAPSQELPKVKGIIEQAKSDTTMMLQLVGYDDGLKQSGVSESLAADRASYLAAYITSYGVSSEQISARSGGIDSTSEDSSKACRVDIYQGVVPQVTPEPTPEPTQATQETPSETPSESSLTPTPTQTIVDSHSDDSFLTKPRLSVRTNLLYWLGGSINAGFEVKRVKSNFGFLVDGGYSPLGGADCEYSMGWWFLAPQARFYFPRNPNWFLGVQAVCGQYNIKFSDTGYQGWIYGAGVTTGYRHKVTKRMDIEYSIGVGYGYLDYDTYYHTQGINVVSERGITKGIVMPIEAGIDLIWRLGSSQSNERR